MKGELADTPWQHEKYKSTSALWQGAALRRKQHFRRTNASLGVCSVDLSGPHEPTPRPGEHVGKNRCRYFLALTVRPDETAEQKDAGVQATDPEQDDPVEQQLTAKKKALIYAALLEAKSEAAAAVKHLLAQVNNDHASYPTDLVFRLHSDQGGEFLNEELNTYCDEMGYS